MYIKVRTLVVAPSNLLRTLLRWLPIPLGVFVLPFASNSSRPAPSFEAARHGTELRALMAAYGADAVTIDRGSRDYFAPDEVKWNSRPGSTSQTANVFGDPTKPGLYVQLLKRGPDDWSQPHAHPNDRYITVLAGTMKIGTGSKFDKNNTVSLGPGSFIKDIAGQMHYDGTGPEGLTIQIVGMGPSGRLQ